MSRLGQKRTLTKEEQRKQDAQRVADQQQARSSAEEQRNAAAKASSDSNRKSGLSATVDYGAILGKLFGAGSDAVQADDNQTAQQLNADVFTQDATQDVVDVKSKDEIGAEAYAGKKAEGSAGGKRYSGFLNLYSRNARRVAGDTDKQNPDASKSLGPSLLTGAWSPYIDARADEEIANGGDGSGFWNIYSGLHNLVGKILGSQYNINGA